MSLQQFIFQLFQLDEIIFGEIEACCSVRCNHAFPRNWEKESGYWLGPSRVHPFR